MNAAENRFTIYDLRFTRSVSLNRSRLFERIGSRGRSPRSAACPEGTCENSPAFQRWVHWPKDPVPKGRLRMRPLACGPFSRPFGTCGRSALFPALKRRAILRTSLRDEANAIRRRASPKILPYERS